MKITKYIHSCLLLEEASEKLLFDPGEFSFKEGGLDPADFDDVNYIVLTHNHPDHIDVDALKKIAKASKATLIGNGEVAKVLKKEGLEVAVLDEGIFEAGAFTLQAIPCAHQPIVAGNLPQHTGYLVNHQFLHGVDSFDPVLEEHKGIELLTVPIVAPFLTEIMAIQYAKRMAPRRVVPVHDGMVLPFFRKLRYQTFKEALQEADIKFENLAEAGDHLNL